MKKGILVVVALFGVVLLSGCDMVLGEKVVCTGKTTESGMESEDKVVATLKNGKIDKVTLKSIYGSEKTAQEMCDLQQSINSINSSGEKINFHCNGKTLEVDNYEVMLETVGIKVSEMNKDEFIKKMESDGLTCK